MIPQTDPAWVRARIGYLTASRMVDALDFRKDGKPSAARVKLMHDLVAERLCDAATDHYVTPAMQWGLDHEAEACERYEAISGNILLPAGFIEHHAIQMLGCTPDRLLDNDGLVEVKCPTTQKFIMWRAAGVVPEEHIPQMLIQLACTRRRYVDFVAFDPRIKDHRLQLFCRRFEPSAEQIAEIEAKALAFLAEVDAMFDQLTQKAA